MASQVLIAHTGQHWQIDTSQFTSLDEFKASVARQSSIPVNCIIALTPQGKPLKLQTVQTEKEIFIYDIRVAQAASPGVSPALKIEIPLPKRYSVSEPPNDLRDRESLQSWQELFKARRTWAVRVAEDCGLITQAAQERYGEIDVMFRCLDAAVANLEGVVKAVESRYADVRRWLEPTQAQYSTLVSRWEHYLALARVVPISAPMLRFMTDADNTVGNGRSSRQPTLEELVDLETARKAGRLAPGALRKFNARVAELERSAPGFFQSCEDLFREFDDMMKRSAMSHGGDAEQLLQDIEALVKKIDTDCQTTLDYSSATRDVAPVSKIAANHTTQLLPSMRRRAADMDDMLRYAAKTRNALAYESIDFMRKITEITSMSTSIRTLVNAVSEEDDLRHFDYLRLIQQTPYNYASYVAEAVRRREWLDKVKTDSSTLANEMALFQDEEMKRRRKWQKSVASTEYGPQNAMVDNQVPGLEVNLLGEDEEWPNMSKKDLDEFHESLRRQKADQELLEDVAKLISDLNHPTKQQSKRMKAFKNGSVHEAALGRSGLLIRGDDDVLRKLQDDRNKLETKLKTAESRVRRLEDLLHRQSQASRPTIGNLFQPASHQYSERTDSTGTIKSPLSSDDRRISSDGADARALQRIQHLEDELNTEKERSVGFERDLKDQTIQNDGMKGQMDEANSTKRDLLENMEALKREFMEERRSLEDEIKRLHARLEDTEDEMEHFGESRENEKASYDEKLHTLQEELRNLRKQRNDDLLKSQGQVDFLRKESKLQRDQNDILTKQLQAANEDAQSVAKKFEDTEQTRVTQFKALVDLHTQLSPDEQVPDDVGDFVEAVIGKSGDLISKLRNVEGDMALLKADAERSQNTVKDLRHELLQTKEKLSTEELATLHLKEKMSEEKARVAALESEIFEGREQLDTLRYKIADGETGSESLRKRLEEEEQKITTLTEDLASKQSQVGSVEEELRLFQEKYHESQGRLSDTVGRFEARTERTKDLTQRLYTQNERLCRLLERLGFTVTREGGSMSIQKVPRSERSMHMSSEQNEASGSIRRSGMLNNRSSGDSADLQLLYWMNEADAEAELEQYTTYMATIGSFDIDAFSETVYRRVKDVEHIARKLQRDLRSYREKIHTVQKEAHEKIAFKHFKEGDLALFLPTRNQTNGAWAAFNIGFPHYFLREQETHRLRNREWLLARISRVRERVVDLSKSLQGQGETESLNEEDNDNPFDLSDGLRWYMIDAQEDKPGAPSTPGLGKSTVAANNVEAMADIPSHMRTSSGKGLGLTGRPSGIDGVSKTLSKSLESRRSSNSSKKALPFAIGGSVRGNAVTSETNSLRAAADTPVATSPTMQQGQMQPPPQVSNESAQASPAKEPSTGEQQQQTLEVRNGNGDALDSLLGP